nr:DUF1826 domain-containing protein [Oceanococcus sp. HetDA_MAG_MS8]
MTSSAVAASTFSPIGVSSEQAAIWAEIYEPTVNLACWQRNGDEAMHDAAQSIVTAAPYLGVRASGQPQALCEELKARLPQGAAASMLIADIERLLNMMMDLFEPPALGLRLEVADRASCPRFHVDRLGVRLVCTYLGPATQWLEHAGVDRSWLGPRAAEVCDESCGLIRPGYDVQSVQTGDAVLLKGEGWHGNDGCGVVHRSPPLLPGQRRLVLSVDPAGA